MSSDAPRKNFQMPVKTIASGSMRMRFRTRYFAGVVALHPGKTRVVCLCALLLLLALGLGATAARAASAAAAGRIVVKFRKQVADESQALKEAQPAAWTAARPASAAPLRRARRLLPAAALSRKAGDKKSVGLDRVFILEADAAADVPGLSAALRVLPEIEYAEPERVMRLDDVPDDPSFPSQWALHNTGQGGGAAGADIDAPEAWDVERGSSAVVIAVVDTGVDYRHPDLAANMWVNSGEIAGNGIDDDGNGYVDDFLGYDTCTSGDCVGPGGDPMDVLGHGTHVAGIAAAATGNGVGIAGVCRNCRIMAVKGFNSEGWGTDTDLAAAIIYAADNGAAVINNSWGGTYSPVIKDAVDYAARTAVIIAAAGNNGSNRERYYPAGLDNVIAVAATDSSDRRAYFSNYGSAADSWVDVAAPGKTILSTTEGGYATMSGTSMATPHVAGLLGLVTSHFPAEGNDLAAARMLSAADSLQLADPVSAPFLGTGRINARRALGELTGPVLVYRGVQVVDSSGNGNSRLDPGETVDLLVTIRNNGLPATTVSGELRIAHPDVYIDANRVAVAELATLRTATLKFTVSLAPGAAINQRLDFELALSMGGGPVAVIPIRIDVPYPLQRGWPANVPISHMRYAVPVDVDGDGQRDVVLGGEYEILPCDRNGSPLWSAPADLYPGKIQGPPSVADVDGDGRGEVFVSANEHLALGVLVGKVWAFDHDGTALPGWPRTTTPLLGVNAPAIGDVDGDGKIEIIVLGSAPSFGGNGLVYGWRSDGTPLAGFGPLVTTGPDFGGTPALADVDGDGDLEIFAVSKRIFGWHHSGAALPGFPCENSGAGTIPFSSPVVGDFDQDGKPEILAAVNYLALVKPDGRRVWTKSCGAFCFDDYHTPAVGDIDGDGDPEIVTSTKLSSGLEELHAYHHTGVEVSGAWPMRVAGSEASPLQAGIPVLANVDDDPEAEIVVSIKDQLWAFNGDGSPVAGFPIHDLDSWLLPAAVDLDGDGKTEILAAAGQAFSYTTPGLDGLANRSWPMFGHDPRHTGCTQGPAIGHSPAALAFVGWEGAASPPAQALQVLDEGVGTLAWVVKSDAGWLTLTPTAGTGAGEVSVAADTSRLAGGTYTATITISAPGAAGSPQTVPVSLVVQRPVAVISPNGGEVLTAGTRTDINWVVLDPAFNDAVAELAYSVDGGATWDKIARLRREVTSYSWKIPRPKKASARCLVRVVLGLKKAAVEAVDFSDGYFTIRP